MKFIFTILLCVLLYHVSARLNVTDKSFVTGYFEHLLALIKVTSQNVWFFGETSHIRI